MEIYKKPGILFNKHLETIYPALFRKVDIREPVPERITTPDGDFLDINWYRQRSKRLLIISHGLEGNYNRGYVLGMAKAFFNVGFDVLTWNYRGCGTEMNLKPRFYHSGATDDLDTIILHSVKQKYESINLVGFSLGGNVTLKYLGEAHPSVSLIDKVVVVSVPLNLDTSCSVIAKSENWAYSYRFLRSLKCKIRSKAQCMELPNIEKLDSINTIREFDEWITGPLHGFKNARDYYEQCSSINFLSGIKTQTLIINAWNDPFLSADCFPKNINRDNIMFLYPDHGGHVGFTLFNNKNLYWSEIMALQFIAGENVKY